MQNQPSIYGRLANKTIFFAMEPQGLVPKSEEKRKGKLNMYMRFTTHYMI
jgi:hypothetical protein